MDYSDGVNIGGVFFFPLFEDHLRLHFCLLFTLSYRLNLLLVIGYQDVLTHDVEVVLVVIFRLGALLVAVDIFARREHLIAEVAVTILYVGVVVVPHQQNPLLNRVQPHHNDIVQHAGVFGRIHNFPIFVIDFKVFPNRLPMLVQVSVNYQASSIRILILILDLLDPPVSTLIDFQSVNSENRPKQQCLNQPADELLELQHQQQRNIPHRH